jgi:nucleotide-binding universal stress UspA family protein
MVGRGIGRQDFELKEAYMAEDFRILLAIDHKTGTDLLLAEAQRYGQALNATVDIVHVVEPDPSLVGYIKAANLEEQLMVDPARDAQAEALRAEHRQTQTYRATLCDRGVRVGRTLTVQGSTLAILLEEARKLGSDLLILGSRHHSALYRFWYGDTAKDVALQPPCALLLIPIST